MKKYILAQTGYQVPLKKSAEIIKAVGFDGVFLSLNQDRINQKDVYNIRDCGLDIETLHLPYNYPFPIINELWRESGNTSLALNILKESIDFAADNEIKIVILHASSGYNPPSLNYESLINFEVLADHCYNKGITLAIENIKRTDYVLWLLTKLPQHVKLCFDIGHANAFTHNLFSSVWDEALNKICCMHLHDNDGSKDQHLMPGMGTINFQAILQKIKAYNNDINLTLELYFKDREQFYNNIDIYQFFSKAALSVKDLL